MSAIRKWSSMIGAILLGLLIIGPMNVSANVIVSNLEWMWTSYPPLDAGCSDNVSGWTEYGRPFSGTNFVDYSGQQGPDLQVVMFVSARSASTTDTSHVFSLEVYDEAGWVRQSSVPWARDSYSVTFHSSTNGTAEYRNDTLSVTIYNAASYSRYWCVYYTDEVALQGQGFDIAFQNYWIKLY